MRWGSGSAGWRWMIAVVTVSALLAGCSLVPDPTAQRLESIRRELAVTTLGEVLYDQDQPELADAGIRVAIVVVEGDGGLADLTGRLERAGFAVVIRDGDLLYFERSGTGGHVEGVYVRDVEPGSGVPTVPSMPDGGLEISIVI